jgi:hypothetical protein
MSTSDEQPTTAQTAGIEAMLKRARLVDRAPADDSTAADDNRRALDRLLARAGHVPALTYDDAVRIRREADALAEQLPAIVRAERNTGRSITHIAADLDYTESYLYRILREHPADNQ